MVHDRTECDPRDLVDELTCPVRSIVTSDTVEDLTLAVTDTSLIDGTAYELAVAYLDECIVLAVLLLTLGASAADLRLVLDVEVLGEDYREELPSCPELLAFLVLVRIGDVDVVQFHDDVHGLEPVKPGVLVSEEVCSCDVIMDRSDDRSTIPW